VSREAPIPQERIDALVNELIRDAEAGSYHLNPDLGFVTDLAAGLLVNEERHGYRSCPCRLAVDDRERDRDIICPCDYRDPDLSEHGACYCALYVSGDVLTGKRELGSVPERRPTEEERARAREARSASIAGTGGASGGLVPPLPVWRCTVCGYLCGRDEPPEVCPICKATKERFDRFL
jgi:ferredoxin-thioredoxin reductase catalytic subunit